MGAAIAGSIYVVKSFIIANPFKRCALTRASWLAIAAPAVAGVLFSAFYWPKLDEPSTNFPVRYAISGVTFLIAITSLIVLAHVAHKRATDRGEQNIGQIPELVSVAASESQGENPDVSPEVLSYARPREPGEALANEVPPDPIRAAWWWGFFPQAAIYLFHVLSPPLGRSRSSTWEDSPITFDMIWLTTMSLYWGSILIIKTIRRRPADEVDIMLIRVGFWPLLLIVTVVLFSVRDLLVGMSI